MAANPRHGWPLLTSKSNSERQNIHKTELILKPGLTSLRGNGDTGKLVYEVCLDGKLSLI